MEILLVVLAVGLGLVLVLLRRELRPRDPGPAGRPGAGASRRGRPRRRHLASALGDPVPYRAGGVPQRQRDQFTDLYSIGATWYYVLAGCAPCEDVVEQMESGPGTMEIAQMVAEGELTPTPLVRRLPHLPIEVAHLVHRLLAPVAEDRAPGTSRTNAAFDLAEEILELDGRLMHRQVTQAEPWSDTE